MTIDFEKIHTAVGSAAFRHTANDEGLIESYLLLLRQLYGEESACSDEEFQKLLKANNEIIVFVTYEGRVVATAQASHVRTPVRHRVLISHVIVHKDFAGFELENIATQRVLDEIKKDWGKQHQLYCHVATTPVDPNNALYRSLGFSPFSEAEGHPLIVWEQILEKY